MASSLRYALRWVPQDATAYRHSLSILPSALVLLGKAYPAHHAPRVEVARELALILVARDQHDDAPLVDVFEVDGSRGAQVARKGLRGLDHHLLADQASGIISFESEVRNLALSITATYRPSR